MSNASLSVGPPVDNTMGAFYLGVIFATALWGAACVQMHYYFSRYPRDDLRLKLLVASVWVFATIHQGLIIHTNYVYLVTQYGNRPFLNYIVRGHLESMLVCGFVCFSVQSFLLHRVWSLSHKNHLVILGLLLLMSGQFASVLLYFGEATKYSTLSDLRKLLWISRSVNIISAISDMSIALVLIYLLHRSRTGFKRSDTIIKRLIIFTLSTGLSTSLCAIMTLVTSLAFPNTLIYITFFLCDSPLYTIALLATLNLRRTAYSGGDTEQGSASTSMGPLRSPSVVASPTPQKRFFNERMLRIKVDTDTETYVDSLGGTSKPSIIIETDTEMTFSTEPKRDFA